MKCIKLLLWSVLAIPAMGQAFVISGSLTQGGYTYSAQADITQIGNQMQIVLTNTANVAAPHNGQLLCGFFWDMSGDPTLTPDAGYPVMTDGTDGYFPVSGSGVLSEEWYFKNQSGGANNAHYGIGAVGYGFFGANDAFAGGHHPLGGGGDYGIAPDAGFSGTFSPVIHNSLTFRLTLPQSYTLSQSAMSNFSFQYGTDLSETNVPVPEPASLVAIAIGAAALIRRRRA